jgi:L-threonylcarbamoyladenylate synthase
MNRGPSTIDDAVDALTDGELIVYPTETFYALGADASDEDALRRLLAAKGREAERTVALIAADSAMAFALAREVPDAARRLAEAFWPGPLTLVIPARSGLPQALVGPDQGVGVRVSSHRVAHELARRLGRPITATSANRAGEPPAAKLAGARAAFGDKVKVYLEGGTLAASAPSTLVGFEAGGIKVLRQGAISARELGAALAEGK